MQQYARLTGGVYTETDPNGAGAGLAITNILGACGSNEPTSASSPTPNQTATATATSTPSSGSAASQAIGSSTPTPTPTPVDTSHLYRPNNDDESDRRPLTETQRKQKERTNQAGLDEYRTEGT